MPSGASVKTLKRMLKKAGLKTTGRKAALTRRAKKAHLLRGGGPPKLPQRSPGTGIMPDELYRIPMRSMTTGIPDDRPQPPPPNLRTNAALPPAEPPKEKKGGRRSRKWAY
jgi:hypothetical protein